MMDSALAFALLMISVFSATGQNVVMIEGPRDRAVLFGQNAELACHVNTTASGSNHVVQWIGNSVKTGKGKQISYNERITASGDIPNKFSISTEKPYNLALQNTDFDDAGKYTCNNVLAGAPIGGLEPYLVVLEPASCLMPNVSTYNESDIISFAWSVAYAGNRDDSQKPTITWTLNGIEQTSVANETTPGVFSTTFEKVADRDYDQKDLKCSFSVLNIQQHCSTRLNIQFTAGAPLGAGHIAGIVIGVLLGVLIFAVMLFYFLVWKKRRPLHKDFIPVRKDEVEEPTSGPQTQSDVKVERRSFFDLTPNEKTQLYEAINKVKKNGKYDELVSYHVKAMNHRENNKAHRGPAFLPWHRQYLLALETEMRNAMNDPKLFIPYWDWGSEAGVKISESKIWDDIGGNGTVSDGPFASWKLKHSDVGNSTLTRGFDTGGRIPSSDAIKTTLKEEKYDESPWNAQTRDGFRNVLEGWSNKAEGMHNTIHVLIGGEMLYATSPNDPVFWMHHAYIDKLWSDWQNTNPRTNQKESFFLPETGASKGHNLDDPLFPWDGKTLNTIVSIRSVLDTDKLGYNYDKPIQLTDTDSGIKHIDGIMNVQDMSKNFANSPYANPNLQ